MPLLAGIDGCPAGWVCVLLDPASGSLAARILSRIDDLLALTPAPGVVALDMPIGLPDSGPRRCDQEARRRLGRLRSSSVFPAPIRPMLAASDYAGACRIGQSVDGRKLSLQAWGLRSKILEVDAFLRSNPPWRDRVYEVHPELSFCLWNGGRAMTHAKKTAPGRAEREALVTARYGPAYAAAQASLPRGRYASDDLLDAFATLWTAERIAHGSAETLPSPPPLDRFGLPMAITA